MATAIYFEARGEPLAGQIAVGQTIMNRVEDNRYPDTVCEVVSQGPTYSWAEGFPVRHRCQFSFYCDGKPDNPKDLEVYKENLIVAKGIIEGSFVDITNGATHYHAKYVLPSWAASKEHKITINNHVFYKWVK